MHKVSVSIFILSFFFIQTYAQHTHRYDLVHLYKENKLEADTSVRINMLDDKQHKDAITLKGYVWLKDISFKKGTIDVDLRGKNVFLQSFLGIAFHGVNDSTYDVIYFRPFNFKHTDTARRKWAVQYMSLPGYDYERLRKEHPLVYENAVTPLPDPDDWFHATIVVDDKNVTVYVDHASAPSLKVGLLNNRNGEKIGLWAYTPGVSGDLQILLLHSST